MSDEEFFRINEALALFILGTLACCVDGDRGIMVVTDTLLICFAAALNDDFRESQDEGAAEETVAILFLLKAADIEDTSPGLEDFCTGGLANRISSTSVHHGSDKF